MRGNPDYIDASCREQNRAASDKFAAERESYRAESEADLAADAYKHEHDAGVLSEDERFAFQAGQKIGERQATISLRELAVRQSGTPWISPRQAYIEGIVSERVRIIDELTALERDTAALWQEGTPVTKAVAAYTAAVRKIVEAKP